MLRESSRGGGRFGRVRELLRRVRARALLRVRDRLLPGLGDFHDVGQDQVARRRVAARARG